MGTCLNSFWRHSSGNVAGRVADRWGADTGLTTGWTGERALICCVRQLLQCEYSRPRQFKLDVPEGEARENMHTGRVGPGVRGTQNHRPAASNGSCLVHGS